MELLIVLAILSVIAGLLFPVFVSARGLAQRTVCTSNFRTAAVGTAMYATDYDDRLLPSNHRPGMPSDPVLDRIWPQLLLPYVRDFRIFDCPSEPNPMEFGGAFDPDLLPGDYASRYYTASLHSDLGYNAYYLAPTVWDGQGWVARPRSTSEVADPSRTLLYVESRGADGGGSYIVVPPCRYIPSPEGRVDTFAQLRRADAVDADPSPVYTPVPGWNPGQENAPLRFGGAWLRHGNRLNVARLDGGARSVGLQAISAGCDVQAAWTGTITDTAHYLWYPGA